PPQTPANLVAEASLDWAIRHLAERESVMPLADLLRHAVRHTGGRANIATIQDAIQQRVVSGTLIRETPHYRNAQDQRASPMTREGWAMEVTRLASVDHPAA